MDSKFDVIVVGAGHAGIEAALASSRMGVKTLLLTMNRNHIGYMSCNPSIGGQAKGQLAREVDALGGEMGENTDRSALQYKKLNRSRGPAVQSSRAQCDKHLYSQSMKSVVENTENLTIFEREVRDLVFENNSVVGLTTNREETISSRSVILTTGTFLKAVMHCGSDQKEGGRAGDSASNTLSASLSANGFKLVRLKTGTPARLWRQSIDFTRMKEDHGDEYPDPFSFYSRPNPFPLLKQLPCYLTYTNSSTHELISAAREKSPMYTGAITGKGPRYCPSIEDKVFRFADKDRHQIFLEPESMSSDEIYANGLSTSLPLDVQSDFLRSIVGLENVEIARPGYAVEYDALDPRILKHTLECKDIDGLFCAGQLNGTSGYEEAAAQGIMAGINAALKIKQLDEFTLARDEAYIGVLIDDLVTKGCDEPYRMFTSRAEFRLSLREDTADFRLGERSHSIGLLNDSKKRVLDAKLSDYRNLESKIAKTFVYPADEAFQSKLVSLGMARIKDRLSMVDLLKRPQINSQVLDNINVFKKEDHRADLNSPDWIQNLIYRELETSIKYEGYISHERARIKKLRRQMNRIIPPSFVYKSVRGLSNEVREKLENVRPESLAHAERISGVTPTALALLMLELDRSSGANADH